MYGSVCVACIPIYSAAAFCTMEIELTVDQTEGDERDREVTERN